MRALKMLGHLPVLLHPGTYRVQVAASGYFPWFGEVTVGEKKEIAGMKQNGGNIRRYEIFVLTKTDHHGRAIAGCNDLIRLIDADHNQGKYTRQFLYSLANRFLEVELFEPVQRIVMHECPHGPVIGDDLACQPDQSS